MADMIDHMTSRFLQWKLPDDFAPDGGVTFTAVGPHGPVGTNLLTYTQAKAMVEYMIDGAPLAALEPASGGVEAHPYSLRPDLQRIVDNAKTAPQWDTERDRLTPTPVATDRVEALVKADTADLSWPAQIARTREAALREAAERIKKIAAADPAIALGAATAVAICEAMIDGEKP